MPSLSVAASQVARRARGLTHPHLIVAIAAILGGVLVQRHYALHPLDYNDFDQVWLGARVLLARQDPYVEVPKGFPWPLLYPLPTILLGIPFAPLPLSWCRVVFAALSAGVLTFAILRRRPHAWPMLLTGPMVYALLRGQWSPLLTASALLPVLGGLVVAKPSVGASIAAYRPTRAMALGAGTLILLSVVVSPRWPLSWWQAIQGHHHIMSLVTLPGGFLLLLALVRWRRPEARLLAALALVPHAPEFYEVVYLLLVPATLAGAILLAFLFNLGYLLLYPPPPLWTIADVPDFSYVPDRWPIMLIFMYLPALVLALGRRPSPPDDGATLR